MKQTIVIDVPDGYEIESLVIFLFVGWIMTGVRWVDSTGRRNTFDHGVIFRRLWQ